MLVFGTEIHIVTFVFIVLETVFFFNQLYVYLSWPDDKIRKYYLILLGLLIVKNLAMGLFPDPEFDIPLVVQYGFTYAAGFVMASYFPYYFYKAYDLRGLRFHATYGIFLFLYLPFITVFLVEYTLTKNIDQSLAHGLYIPAAYSLVLAYVMWKSIQKEFRKEIEERKYWEIIGLYFSVIPFIAIAFFPDITQLVEAIITNAGFIVLTFFFTHGDILKNRRNKQMLDRLTKSAQGQGLPGGTPVSDPQALEHTMNNYGFTSREKEVMLLVRVGHTNRKIAEEMGIKVGTVKKHVENIFQKTGVSNRTELIHKLTQNRLPEPPDAQN